MTEIVTVDIDSTLADTGHRHHLIDRVNGTDWDVYSLACEKDTPIKGMVETIRLLAQIKGIEIHALSGRSQVALHHTKRWFDENSIPVKMIWLDETGGGGWSDKYDHAEYKLVRLREIEAATGNKVRLHFDDWASVAVKLEKNGIPCVCVRTPQEIEELTSVAPAAGIR